MASLTELEAWTIMFSILVFALFTLIGMINEECPRSEAALMDLPFSSFELTFIILAFVIFSLFSLASVCIRPEEAGAEDGAYEGKKLKQKVQKKQKEITKPAGQQL